LVTGNSVNSLFLFPMNQLAIFLLCLLFLSPSFGFSQGDAIQSEREWLIDYHFSEDTKIAGQLAEIQQAILEGNYPKAKKLLQTVLDNSNSKQVRAAAQTYAATVAYNESNYLESIALTESAAFQLKSDKNNRYYLRALNYKAKALGALNDYQEAILLVDSVTKIALKTGDQYNLAAAYYYRGSFLSDLGDYKKALTYIQRSVAIRKEINDQPGLAASYSFLGLCYSHLDEYLKGIEFIQKSITIREKLEDKRGLANSYLTLYKVYFELGELDKALESEFKSLAICEEIGDLQCVSGRYTNLGQLYQRKGDLKEAMRYHQKALELSKRLLIKNRIAQVHENIARVHAVSSKNELARLHLDSSENLRLSFGDKEGLATISLLRAELALSENRYGEAKEFAEKTLSIAGELRLRYMLKEAHHILSQVYQQENKINDAFYHFQQFVHLKDSLFNAEQSRALVKQELEFSFARKEAQQRAEEEARELRRQEEKERLWKIILWVTVGLALLSVLLLFSIWQYRQKNKSNQRLTLAYAELNQRNEELKEKNDIIETQNHEINDSIVYAQKIQHAVLPDVDELIKPFSAGFLLFEPKDQISGDFYWISQLKSQIVVVTADCTGHGVPGGFMSMLGISFLNELVNEQHVLNPASILDKLREKVIAALRQKGTHGEQKDGMDMTVCVYDLKKKKMRFSCANHVLYLARQSADGHLELTEHKGNRFPVGIFGDALQPFHEFELDIQAGDRIYSFTDGYPDQFGGPKGKKFKYQQLKSLLSDIQHMPMNEQEKMLLKAFKSWKAETEQTDDVCVIGIEI
jgi:serine phosphatase RsbU (regulator of sigma subunit)